MRYALKKRKIIFLFFVILFLISLFFIYYITQIRPLLEEYVLNDVRNQTNLMINKIIEEEIANNAVTYNSLVNIDKSSDGQITSISSDVYNMNRLKVSIEDKILEEILRLGKISVDVPIGNLLGNELFLGRGPGIEIAVTPIASVYARFQNEFDSAGVNQTRHRILLNYDVCLKIMLPGKREETVISSSVCIAETIVVGLVPRLFTGEQN